MQCCTVGPSIPISISISVFLSASVSLSTSMHVCVQRFCFLVWQREDPTGVSEIRGLQRPCFSPTQSVHYPMLEVSTWPKRMPQYPKIESIGSIGSLLLALLEVQVSPRGIPGAFKARSLDPRSNSWQPQENAKLQMCYTYIYICIHIYIYMYIHIERDRERERESESEKGLKTHRCNFQVCSCIGNTGP